MARPGSVCSPAGILPVSGTPMAARPVGHILRGAISTPGRPRWARAAARAAAETVGRSTRRRRSCRSGRTGAAPGSSSWRAQELHPALVVRGVVAHRVLLGGPGLRRRGA